MIRYLWPAVILSIVIAAAWQANGDEYFPRAAKWESVVPADAGMDPAKLQAALDYALKQKSFSALVVRGGRIVGEAYAPTWGQEKRHEIFSAAKSVVAVLALMALEDGKFKSLDQPLVEFVPAWKGTDKEKLTLLHFLNMTSGLRQAGLQLRNVPGDQFALNTAAPLDYQPGTHWEYNTAAYHLVYHWIAKATGEKFETYAQRRLLAPLEVENWSWVANIGQGTNGPVSNYYAAECTTRDMARFGLLLLRQGRWQDKQLLRSDLVKTATTPSQSLNPSYGLLIWLNSQPGRGAAVATRGQRDAPAAARVRFPSAPPDTFAALGFQDQDILIVPSLDLVVARQGEAPKATNFSAELLARVIAAIKN